MFFRILWNQIRFKKVRNGLLLALVTAITTLYIFVENSAEFSDRSMKLIMKRMGHNMLILPETTNPMDVYHCTDNQPEFPDTVTRFLAGKTDLLSKYYVSCLQREIELNGRRLVLTGIEPVARPDETKEKGNMVKAVGPGHARLGAEAAERLMIKPGDTLAIQSKKLHVETVMPRRGTSDDFRVYVALQDAQIILGKPGRINGIMAFECLHAGSLEHSESYQKAKLAETMPGFRHISNMKIAKGRYLGRVTTSSFLGSLLTVLVIVAALAIVIVGLQEVADRKYEISIMSAMGADHFFIAGLFLVKMVFLASLGALMGFIIGGNISVLLTSDVLVSNTLPVHVQWEKLPGILAWAAGIAAAAEMIPLLTLARYDPGATLMEE